MGAALQVHTGVSRRSAGERALGGGRFRSKVSLQMDHPVAIVRLIGTETGWNLGALLGADSSDRAVFVKINEPPKPEGVKAVARTKADGHSQ